jgi:aminoglycoside phosphotransferase (APT) family kinase protein
MPEVVLPMIHRALVRVRRTLARGRKPIEIDVDAALVRRLLEEQFPAWAGLPLHEAPSCGTVNALFRLGDDMIVRVPGREWGLGATDRESDWLPRLAPHLPVAVPEVLGRGEPTAECPLPWLITRLLPGATPTPGALEAPDLARFVMALGGVDATGAPPSWRGGLPLESYDAEVRRSIAEIPNLDAASATAAWEQAIRLPAWQGRPVWVHADLWAGNVLVTEGRLSAVLDWATSGTGDPAYDLACAWTLLPAGARAVFRDAVSVDDATWERGRGLALAVWIVSLRHFTGTQPEVAAQARYTVEQVLADQKAPK